MTRHTLIAALAVRLFGQVPIQSLAQSKGVVVSADYQPRYPISVTHGQVITITVAGLGDDIQTPVLAESAPLPKDLAGLSAVFHQVKKFDAPILKVEPFWTCPLRFTAPLDRGEKCGTLLAVTLQVPFELDQLQPSPLPGPLWPQLTIYYKGAAGAAVDLWLVRDAVHLLRKCDSAVRAAVTPNNLPTCDIPVVVHSDGTPVTQANPAKAGETVAMYAFGLGPVPGAPPSGRLAPSPIAVSGFKVNYGFGAGARPPLQNTLEPEFIGLSSGGVGLYQINFKIPPVPEDIAACRIQEEWNFAISVTRASSDWVGLCVEPAKSAQ